jgi:hypothetical protein
MFQIQNIASHPCILPPARVYLKPRVSMQTQSDHRDVHQGCGSKRNQAVNAYPTAPKATLKVEIILTILGRARNARHVEG